MRTEDWPAVKAIYEQGIATKNATFDTEAPAWEDWDAGHLAEPRLVAERDGEVVALGGALADFAPSLLRRASSRAASTSTRPPAARGSAASSSARSWRGRRRRDLDGPDIDLPREHRQRRAAPGMRLPRCRRCASGSGKWTASGGTPS